MDWTLVKLAVSSLLTLRGRTSSVQCKPRHCNHLSPSISQAQRRHYSRSPSKTLAGTGNRRIFAYIICVNDYEAEKVPKLRACVEDGKRFEGFLRTKFHDEALQINTLYDKEATYDGILSLFENALSNTLVQKGDLVILFYAGHGSRTPGPKGWSTEDGRIETICPYDIETKKGGNNIYGIPDFVVGTVMKNIANEREANVVSAAPVGGFAPY